MSPVNNRNSSTGEIEQIRSDVCSLRTDLDSVVGRVRSLGEVIGQAPDPTQGTPGSGMAGVVSDVLTTVHEIKANQEARKAKARDPVQTASALLGIVAIIASLVAGCVAGVSWVVDHVRFSEKPAQGPLK